MAAEKKNKKKTGGWSNASTVRLTRCVPEYLTDIYSPTVVYIFLSLFFGSSCIISSGFHHRDTAIIILFRGTLGGLKSMMYR